MKKQGYKYGVICLCQMIGGSRKLGNNIDYAKKGSRYNLKEKI